MKVTAYKTFGIEGPILQLKKEIELTDLPAKGDVIRFEELNEQVLEVSKNPPEVYFEMEIFQMNVGILKDCVQNNKGILRIYIEKHNARKYLAGGWERVLITERIQVNYE